MGAGNQRGPAQAQERQIRGKEVDAHVGPEVGCPDEREEGPTRTALDSIPGSALLEAGLGEVSQKTQAA